MRLRWVVVALAALLMLGAWSVRAAGWSPVAPPGQPATPYARAEAADPTSWQTLSDRSFELDGAAFHAEVQGFARLTSTAVHAFQLRIVRTGGDDVRLDIDPRANGDVRALDRPSLEQGVWVVRLEVYPLYDNASLLAEADLTPYHAAAWAGFVAGETFRLALPFSFESTARTS